MAKKILFVFLLLQGSLFAQETEFASQTFRDTRVINGHSIETNVKGEAKFIIGHRFGSLDGGSYELFGLDQATIRFGLDYGVNDRLTLGAGRSSFQKTVDGFVKYKILQQSSGAKNMPITITVLAAMAVNGLRYENPDITNYFTSRLTYTYQLLIAKKISHAISLQLMPSMVHRNIIDNPSLAHDVFAVGGAGRFQVSKQIAIMVESYFVIPGQLASDKQNSVSLGMDLETKGHVFQFHVSNSRGMTEKFFITETRGVIEDLGLHIGFNFTRDFRIRGRR